MIEPCFDDLQVGRAFDAGDRAIARNQQRARYFAMPLRIDLVAQALDEAVGKHPVFGCRQSRLRKHGGDGIRLIRNQVGVDYDQIEVGPLLQKLAPTRHFDPNRGRRSRPRNAPPPAVRHGR